MNNNFLQNRDIIAKIILACVFTYPFAIVAINHSFPAWLIFNIIISLWFVAKHQISLTKIEKIWWYGNFMLIVYIVMSLLWTEDYDNAWKPIGNLLKFSFVFPLYLLFKHYNQNLKEVFMLSMILIGPFILLFMDTNIIDTHRQSITNNLDAIKYSFVALVFMSFAVILLFNTTKASSRKMLIYIKIGLVISAVCSFTAVLSSGTRGAYILIPVVVVLFFIFEWFARRYKNIFIMTATFLLLSVAAISLAPNNLTQRYNNGIEDINSFIAQNKKQDNNEQFSSAGFRLKSWEISIKLWLAKPFVGYGIGDFTHEIRKYTKQHNVTMFSKLGFDNKYHSPHNIYFFLLVNSGLIGLILMIVTWFVFPIIISVKNLKRNRANWSNFLVIMLAVIFFGFGLSINWLMSSFGGMYLYLLPLLLALSNPSSSQTQ